MEFELFGLGMGGLILTSIIASWWSDSTLGFIIWFAIIGSCMGATFTSDKVQEVAGTVAGVVREVVEEGAVPVQEVATPTPSAEPLPQTVQVKPEFGSGKPEPTEPPDFGSVDFGTPQ
jgi:hypothetical protein